MVVKIALLSWETLHSISVGGVGVHVTELAAAFERKGNEVHVFTRMGPGQNQYDWIDGVHYHRCPFELHPEFYKEIENMCQSFVHHLYQTEDMIGPFDIVHGHDWLTAIAMIWIKHGRQRKAVFTMHSTEYGRCGNLFYNGQSDLIRKHERAGTYWADRVITVSKSLKDEIMWMYEVPDWKVSVVYNGVNVHQWDGFINPSEIKNRYSIGPMDPMVLFAGRMVYQKGPDLLVETIPWILQHYANAKFAFAGDGEMRNSIEGRVRDLNISHATRFVGYKAGGELADLYKSCDVVCVPSRNEPFGIVVLEGWSAGKPVIATINGGPNEYLSHEVNGLKVSPTPNSLAWGIGTLFTDFDWAKQMGRNGRQAVENAFSWDAIGGQVLSVLNQ